MFTPTITKHDLLEGDKLLYRGNWIIRAYEAVLARDWKHFFVAFSHTAQMVYNREIDDIQRYDAMEGMKTGFRPCIGQAYVFRWIEPMTGHQAMVWRNYLLARQGSSYDLGGAITGKDNEFKDYCSELSTNADIVAGKIKPIKGRLRPQQYYKKLRGKWKFIGVIL